MRDRPAECIRIVIELDSGANFHLRIRRTHLLDHIEIDSFVIAIVIGEGDVG